PAVARFHNPELISAILDSTAGILRVSTSVAYLRKRLAAVGAYDLLAAAERGELSYYCAAEAAGLVTRRAVIGNGSPNQAKKRAWLVMKVEGGLHLSPTLSRRLHLRLHLCPRHQSLARRPARPSRDWWSSVEPTLSSPSPSGGLAHFRQRGLPS